ncbi:restriction endonuclease subunit S [Nostoc flagelliforme]|nr:restriction endonuclease subunit S [Nostoc flagelliforme]
MSEELIELPEGWEWVQAENLCQITSGYAFKSSDFCEEGIPAIKIANISYGKFLWKQQEYLPKEFLEKYWEFQVLPKTLLIALTRPITNNTVKVCFYPEDAPIGLLNQRVALIKPYNIYSQKLLLFFSQSDFFINQINTNLSETLQPNLSPQSLKQFLIPLPPLNEQKRIVAKIEELNDRTQRAKEALDSIPQLCDRFRQSVLAAAFRGDLTADWREQNPDVEPASVLVGESSNNLPYTWYFTSVGNLIDSLKYGTSQKCSYKVEGVPVLRIPNIGSGVIDHSDLKYAELPKKEFK